VKNYENFVAECLITEDESEYAEESCAVSKQSNHFSGGSEKNHRTA
jgi:hypothetical protein